MDRGLSAGDGLVVEYLDTECKISRGIDHIFNVEIETFSLGKLVIHTDRALGKKHQLGATLRPRLVLNRVIQAHEAGVALLKYLEFTMRCDKRLIKPPLFGSV